MFQKIGADFTFISTSVMRDDRKKLGYKQEFDARFVMLAHDSEQQKRAVELIKSADVVIAGAAPEAMLADRVNSNKLLFRYSERPFKNNPSALKRMYHLLSFHARDFGNKNVYMLCASAYAASDFHSIGMYRNRTYKWGYFPQTKEYQTEDLMAQKDRKSLLWCGRFLDWKHPDDALRVAARLKAEGYDFCLNIIGTGEMQEELTAMAEQLHLSDCVRFLGSMSTDKVRMYMERAGVLLFTSDRFEGWGAVLNEAMNSGCAVVASHAIGSVPFLIQDDKNGCVYESGNIDMLYQKVAALLRHPEKQTVLGVNAYRTIREDWNAATAAERILKLASRLSEEKNGSHFYGNGVCSYAEVISTDWKNSF